MSFQVNYSRNADLKSDKLKKFTSSEFYFHKHFQTDTPEVIFTSLLSIYNISDFLKKVTKSFGEEIKVYKYYQYYDNNKKSYLKEILIVDEKLHFILSFITTDFSNIENSSDPEFYDFSYPGESELSEEEIQAEIDQLESQEVSAVVEMFLFRENEEELQKIFDKLISNKTTVKKKKREINIIGRNEHGFYLQGFKTIKTEVDIELNYNEGFSKISEIVVEKLSSENNKGIVLFAGIPGSGKTSYIRFLTNKIKTKRLIYIPPDMANCISDPDFIPFLMKYSNSIIIIEDAENVLKSRKAGGNQSVANLLNLSDGLLGDCLKLQVVCTFNCHYNEVDEALKRPGRLIAHYEFKELELERAQILFNKIHKRTDVKLEKSLTLAEVYNYFEIKIDNSSKQETIGFKQRKY